MEAGRCNAQYATILHTCRGMTWGISAYWYGRKSGCIFAHLMHWIDRIWALAYNRHNVTQYHQVIQSSKKNTKTGYGRNQTNKRQPPKLSPDRPYWAPQQIIRKGNLVTAKVFVELPLEFSGITCIGLVGTYNCVCSIRWVTRTQQSQNLR